MTEDDDTADAVSSLEDEINNLDAELQGKFGLHVDALERVALPAGLRGLTDAAPDDTQKRFMLSVIRHIELSPTLGLQSLAMYVFSFVLAEMGVPQPERRRASLAGVLQALRTIKASQEEQEGPACSSE